MYLKNPDNVFDIGNIYKNEYGISVQQLCIYTENHRNNLNISMLDIYLTLNAKFIGRIERKYKCHQEGYRADFPLVCLKHLDNMFDIGNTYKHG